MPARFIVCFATADTYVHVVNAQQTSTKLPAEAATWAAPLPAAFANFDSFFFCFHISYSFFSFPFMRLQYVFVLSAL